MFFDSITNNYTISFHSWHSDRKVVNDGLEFQADIGSAQNINSFKRLIAAHQLLAGIGIPNKTNSVEKFDTLDFRK